ncbi:NAD(P)-binding protein [Kribbella caucasensis]|uniref:NAD(P)-binding protein n=1 Tax=Kribbella caucasensis TaxID=2512215 RepID=UPI003519F807
MEHLDVLVVGAGLSGIGAAYRLQTQSPQRSYAVLEARPDLGGTWDLFRYPTPPSTSTPAPTIPPPAPIPTRPGNHPAPRTSQPRTPASPAHPPAPQPAPSASAGAPPGPPNTTRPPPHPQPHHARRPTTRPRFEHPPTTQSPNP